MPAKLTNRLLAVFFAAAAVLGAYRTYLLFCFVDSQTGLYTEPGAGRLYFVGLLVLVAAAILVMFIFSKTSSVSPENRKGAFVKVAAVLCILCFAAVFIKGIYDLVSGRRIFGILFGAELVLCVPALIYFVMILAKKTISKEKLSVYNLLPAFPTLYTAIHTISLFTDTSKQINSSERSFTLLTLVFFMMFFITETEFFMPDVPEEPDKKKRVIVTLSARYAFYGTVCVCLTLAVIVPQIISVLCGGYAVNGIFDSLLCISFGIYATGG